jgi:colanic acid biosynthesis glycosyl transferase WcaI
MKQRILLLTQWFDPEPTFKGMVFARELVAQGFDVEVLTGFPNYPNGKIYAGYKIKFLQRELIDGVHVTRVPLYPNHSQSAIKRVLNYASFAFSSLIYGLFFAKRPDVVYAYHPPLTVGVTAVVMRIFRKIPVVYDIQDMWPDTLRATGMLNNSKILNVVECVCQWVYKRVDCLVVLSPGFKDLLVERNVPAEKIKLIYNWADEGSLAEPLGVISKEFPSEDRFRVVFAGNMGKAQALGSILEAAKILLERRSRVCFVLIGGGVELAGLLLKSKEMNLSNVFFIPAVPMGEIGLFLNEADALLVHLRKDPLFRVTIPSKTQAYMSIGRPLIMAVDGDAADLVRLSNGGVLVDSENAEMLANETERLSNLSEDERRIIGKNAKDYYQENLSVKAGVAKFADIFKQLALKGLK